LEINKKIFLPSKNGYNVVRLNNILYCKADINYTVVYTTDGKSYTIASTLKHLEGILPNTIFFRTHKSFLVNMNYVKTFDRSTNKAVLENGVAIDIATRRMDSFLQALKGN
jgi:two-component system, LytTR family, response regulator